MMMIDLPDSLATCELRLTRLLLALACRLVNMMVKPLPYVTAEYQYDTVLTIFASFVEIYCICSSLLACTLYAMIDSFHCTVILDLFLVTRMKLIDYYYLLLLENDKRSKVCVLAQ